MTGAGGNLTWQHAKLGEFFRIKHGYAFKSKYFDASGDYIVLTPGNFRRSGGLHLKGDKEKYYTGEFPEEFLLQRGDLLLVMTDLTQNAPILGSPAFVPEDDRFLHNQRLGKIVGVKDTLDARFLYYLLNSAPVRQQIRASATGATVRHTAPDRIYSVAVYLPPLEIQRKIAAILGAHDDLIENNLRRIHILEEIAQLIYREWFVNFRFPGHEKVRMVDSRLGKMREGWMARELGEVVELQKGRKPREVYDVPLEGAVPYLLIEGLKGGDYAYAGAADMRIARTDDVVMVMDGASSGDVYVGASGAVGSTLAYIRVQDQQVLSPFALYMFLLENATQIKASHIGAAIPHANKDYILRMWTPIPPSELNGRFHEISSAIFGEIANLRETNRNVRTTRDLLLPRLVSGQLDVEGVEVH